MDSLDVKLTKKGEYALRTLIQLGIAHRSGLDVVSVSTLAAKDKLPFKFIEQILFQLRGSGYITTKRGKDGGARLAKDPSEIYLGEIVRLIDGKLAPISCASETAYKPCTCPSEANCGLRMLMIDVRNAIADILDRYTLLDVIEVSLNRMRSLDKFDRCQPNPRRADPADGFLANLIKNHQLP